jgi:acetyl esterase
MISETIIREPESGNPVQILDVTYRQDKDGAFPARVYMLESGGPFPALLDIHGGAWNVGGRTDNEMIDQYLAASGMVVVAIECRRAPTYPYPSQVVDVNYATRWLKAHAADFNAVSDGIGGLGASSGGHSLLLSAMRPGDARYNALHCSEEETTDARLCYLVALWPVLDPYGRYGFAKENRRDFLAQATDAYFLESRRHAGRRSIARFRAWRNA